MSSSAAVFGKGTRGDIKADTLHTSISKQKFSFQASHHARDFCILKNVKILLFFPQEGIFVSQFTAAFMFVSSNFPTSWWNFLTIFFCAWDTLQQASKTSCKSVHMPSNVQLVYPEFARIQSLNTS